MVCHLKAEGFCDGKALSPSGSSLTSVDACDTRSPLISSKLRYLMSPPHVPRKRRTPRIPYGESCDCSRETLESTSMVTGKIREEKLQPQPGVGDCGGSSTSAVTVSNEVASCTSDSDETNEIKMATETNEKSKKRKKTEDIGPILDMPTATREKIEAMGAYDIELVIQKILTLTDLSQNHGRLSLPTNKLIAGSFLTKEEETLLGNNDGKMKKGMTVRIFYPDLKESTICFKKWKIGSKQTYCLMTQWNLFVKETQLKWGDEIQLWCFRTVRVDPASRPCDSNLCFAMIKIPKDSEEKVRKVE